MRGRFGISRKCCRGDEEFPEQCAFQPFLSGGYWYDHREMADYEQWPESMRGIEPEWSQFGQAWLPFSRWHWRTNGNLVGWPSNVNTIRNTNTDPRNVPTPDNDKVATWWFNDVDSPEVPYNAYATPPDYTADQAAFDFQLAAPRRNYGQVTQVVGKMFPLYVEMGATGFDECVRSGAGWLYGCDHPYWPYVPNPFGMTMEFRVSNVSLAHNAMLRIGWMGPEQTILLDPLCMLIIRRRDYWEHANRQLVGGGGTIGLKTGSMWALASNLAFDSGTCAVLPTWSDGDPKFISQVTGGIRFDDNRWCPHILLPNPAFAGQVVMGNFELVDLDHTAPPGPPYFVPGLSDAFIPSDFDVRITLIYSFEHEAGTDDPWRGVHTFNRYYEVNGERWQCEYSMDWRRDLLYDPPPRTELGAMQAFRDSVNCGSFLADGWVQGPGQFSDPLFQAQTPTATATVSDIRIIFGGSPP